MKKHVKSLNEFVSGVYNQNPIDVAHSGVAVPTTNTGAQSNDEVETLVQFSPVQQYGQWATSAISSQPSNTYPDSLLAQAAMHGMTPQEYLAYYGRDTEGHDK
jgi:hypothetical protein